MYENIHEVAEVELIYKTGTSHYDRPTITCSKDAYLILLRSWDDNKIDFCEQAKVMLLNRANQVLGLCEISSGGISGTIVDPRLVFVAALKANASSIILAHNHPSSNLHPSRCDKQLTEQLEKAGKFLHIDLSDHLIITREGYYSFKEDLAVYEIF